MKKIILFWVLNIILLFQNLVFSQFIIGPEETRDSVYKSTIRSVLFHRDGWELSYPIINLHGDEAVLLLRFDDLDADIKDYSYTLIHCDAKWNPTSLIPDDYLSGFFENQIRDNAFSFNTSFDYINYELLLPNEDVQFKLAGNYILKVYEGFDKDNVVFVKRFMVVDPKITIEADVERSNLSDYYLKGQEVRFKIIHDNYAILDPISELHVVITQNNRWDNAIYDVEPTHIQEGEIGYGLSIDYVFLSGNEYRAVDLKSINYLSERIESIDYEEPYYHIRLKEDEVRTYKSYIYNEDFNGMYFVDEQESTNKHTDADYVYVYFSLPVKNPVIESEVYIFGALTNWKCNDRSKMTYNYEGRKYELMLLLKQGYYNYEYAIIDNQSGFIDNTYFEGSYFDTENDYIIYVYHYDRRLSYDKLIGVLIINSLVED